MTKVVYEKKRGAGGVPAPELLRLAAEALLGLDEEVAAKSPLASEEELLAAALEEAAQRLEPEASLNGAELLRRLREAGWLQEPGRGGFAAAPELLRALELRALKRLLLPPPARAAGPWPQPGRRGPHEPHGAAVPWRWGEPLRLDAAATLQAALPRPPAELHPADLRVREGEGGRRLAVALLLDCSHSMVLYGADRFGPAKRTALALAHWVRAGGGESQAFCIHDEAEEIAAARLPFVRVQPSHTNTAAGLARAREWLRRRSAAERVAVLITDGRPTAVTTDGGRVYKNAWGDDPLIREKTLAAAVRLRKTGVHLQLYLLGGEEQARAFSAELVRRAHGVMVETDPERLGWRVLLDLQRLN